jgi:glycosyltransferase involved in cell wall biosynthesis
MRVAEGMPASECDMLVQGEASQRLAERSERAEGTRAKAAPGFQRLRIGIDVSRISREQTGVGYYITHLVEALALIDQDNDYILYPYFWHFFPSDHQSVPLPKQANFRLHRDAQPFKRSIRAWRSPKPARVLGPLDVLYSPNMTAPRVKKAKLVVTIHDLSYAVYPDFHTRANVRFARRQTAMAAKYAAKIIAVSHHTKRDLMSYYSIPEERIQVIHEAARKAYYPEWDLVTIQRCLARLNIR